MIRRQHVVRNFFQQAEDMRASLDEKLRKPYVKGIKWEYFCDPQLYTYLRTDPRDALPTALFSLFLVDLRSWCLANLGLVPKGRPMLHLMVNGCRLGMHSDFHNGTLGYVFSLTRWKDRRFSGGETLLLRDGVPSYKRHHVHGDVLYELVPAEFNQLLVFDDRLVHATPMIEGNMDPVDGRIALVGHIVAASPIVTGPLDPSGARNVIVRGFQVLKERLKIYRDVQGTVTYRISVSTRGRVEGAAILADTIVTPIAGYDKAESVESVKAIIHKTIVELRFPEADGDSEVVLAALVPLPDMEAIRFDIAHELHPESLKTWMSGNIELEDDSVLGGSWQGFLYEVSAPIAGTIHVGPKHLTFNFDPPMWVPSQRAAFENALKAWAVTALKGNSN